MPCRVGITTDLERRKKEHESDYENVNDWKVLGGPFDDREEAQALEDIKAEELGCESHGGGGDPDDPDAKWYVYYFTHDGKKDKD